MGEDSSVSQQPKNHDDIPVFGCFYFLLSPLHSLEPPAPSAPPRFSNPLMSPDGIREIFSNLSLSSVCLDSLINPRRLASLESFGCGANRVGKVDGLLIDNQLLKHKTHAVSLGVLSRRRQAATTAKRVESRK